MSARYCSKCMKAIDENSYICPHCGWDNKIQNPSNLLKIGVVLKNRYLIGAFYTSSPISAIYMGLDLEKNKRVYVEEFFPQTICKRDKNNVCFDDEYNILYKTMASDMQDRWERIAEINSPSATHFCEIFSLNNTVYAVTSYVKKITLESYLATKPMLSWEKLKKMFMPIFSFLATLNSQGISHCGISPENIWVTKDGKLIVSGFSLPEARTMGSIVPCELYSGFSAPEQYKKNLWQGEWTDVYSLAATLFYAITLNKPVDATKRLERDTQRVVAYYNDNIPDNASIAIKNAMNLDKKNRFSNIDSFSAALLNEVGSNTAVFGIDRTRVVSTETAKNAIKNSVEVQANNITKSSHKKYDGKFIAIVILAILMTGSLIANTFLLYKSEEKPIEETSSMVEIEPEVVIPLLDESFVGMHKKAILSSQNQNISFMFVYEYSEEYPENIVIKQSVQKGEPIPENKKITLTVSKGSRFVTIPYLIGSSKDFASRALTNMGIKYDIVYTNSDTSDAPVGTVVDMSVSYGVKFDKETERVIITIKGETLPSIDDDKNVSLY